MVAPSWKGQTLLQKYRMENFLLKSVAVSEEERKECEQLYSAKQPLPDGIYRRDPPYDYNLYFRIEKQELSKELEMVEELVFKQSKQIKTLKIIVAFLFALPFILSIIYFFIRIFE
ncbi:MAG: hypothetical protein WCN92_01970 [Eubacteriales bacterium]